MHNTCRLKTFINAFEWVCVFVIIDACVRKRRLEILSSPCAFCSSSLLFSFVYSIKHKLFVPPPFFSFTLFVIKFFQMDRMEKRDCDFVSCVILCRTKRYWCHQLVCINLSSFLQIVSGIRYKVRKMIRTQSHMNERRNTRTNDLLTKTDFFSSI